MVTIKKYGNRRLYDTSRAAYINLDDLAELIRGGEEVEVVDAKTGVDLTQDVLLQVVIEVLRGVDLLPVGMLRRIIRSTSDDPVQLLVRKQLSTGLTMLSDQLDRAEAMLGWATPGAGARPAPKPAAAAPEPEPEPDTEPPGDPEMDALRARLAALEQRLSRG